MSPRVKWLMRLFATLAILSVIFAFVPVREVFGAFRGIRLQYAAAGFLLGLGGRYLAAVQTRLLTRHLGMSLTVGRIFRVGLITRFYALFLPGYLSGGAIRWWRLSSPERKWSETLASIGFSRLLHTAVVVTLGLSFFAVDPVMTAYTSVIIAAVVLLSILISFHLVLMSPKAGLILERVLRSPLLPGSLAKGPRRVMTTAVAQYRECRGLLLPVVALSCARFLVGILAFLAFAAALRLTIGFVSVGWIRSVTHVLNLLPISISGLGVREVALVVLLRPYGIEAPAAVALSLLLFARGMLSSVIGGLLEVRTVLGLRARRPLTEERGQ